MGFNLWVVGKSDYRSNDFEDTDAFLVEALNGTSATLTLYSAKPKITIIRKDEKGTSPRPLHCYGSDPP